MPSGLFPKQFGNASYGGRRLAIWLFVPIVLLRLVMGANSIFFTRLVATSADGIPLDTYNAAGAQAVISLFALLGLSLLMLALQGVVVLIRYRSMLPFMYLLLLIQQLGAKAVAMAHPIAASAASSARSVPVFALTLLAATVVGFVLSLVRGSHSAGRANPA